MSYVKMLDTKSGEETFVDVDMASEMRMNPGGKSITLMINGRWYFRKCTDGIELGRILGMR